MAGVHHAISGAASAALGKKTLKEVVFDASGTFVVPANAIDNKFYVGCTGGGGGGVWINTGEGSYYGGGGGSGRVSGNFVLTPGMSLPVTVGAGGSSVKHNSSIAESYRGGSSSFSNLLTCDGGTGYSPDRPHVGGLGVSGGGNGGYGVYGNRLPGASNCPAMFTVDPTAIDNTAKFYTAKSYVYANNVSVYHTGGAGCYWRGGEGSTETPRARPNTGGGGQAYVIGGAGDLYGGSGKVVIYYYTYE